MIQWITSIVKFQISCLLEILFCKLCVNKRYQKLNELVCPIVDILTRYETGHVIISYLDTCKKPLIHVWEPWYAQLYYTALSMPALNSIDFDNLFWYKGSWHHIYCKWSSHFYTDLQPHDKTYVVVLHKPIAGLLCTCTLPSSWHALAFESSDD